MRRHGTCGADVIVSLFLGLVSVFMLLWMAWICLLWICGIDVDAYMNS